MALSPHLRDKLKDLLGQPAAEELVTFVEHNDSLRADIAELRHEMQLGFARLEAGIERMATREDLERVRSDLMKWSFVFWTGSVIAIAALAGILR